MHLNGIFQILLGINMHVVFTRKKTAFIMFSKTNVIQINEINLGIWQKPLHWKNIPFLLY